MSLFRLGVPLRRFAVPKLAAASILLVALCFAAPRLAAQDRSAPDHSMHDGMSMPADGSMEGMDHHHHAGPTPAERLAWKKESEFNHHLAGFLVILAGLFILGESSLRQRWSWVRFAWPMCFLLSGLFLLVWSDTELWPFGPMSWWYGLTHNKEDLQHKTFAVILLALGLLETQRARGALKAAWSAWVFPVLAFAGSILLLFHDHHSGMHGADHLAVMARIQSEHYNFAAVGLGIGLSKGLSDMPIRWRRVFAKLWPILMIALGVLLMLYTE